MKISIHSSAFALLLALTGAFAIGGFTGGCKPTNTSDTPGQFVDDSVITTKVKSALLADDAVKSFEIKVETVKGVVQLSGFVDSIGMVDRAGEVAGQVTGVREVKNDLNVK